MTEDDLIKIQEELNISLPGSYCELMTNNPYPEYEGVPNFGIYFNADVIIDENQHHRNAGWFDIEWPVHYLIIGDIGNGDLFFMATEKDDQVYICSHEAGAHPVDELEDCLEYESVQELLEEEVKFECEYQEEQHSRAERKKNKKWWQFWI